MRPPSRRKRHRIGHDRWRAARTPNIAALPAIARLGTCESARGPDADRHVKLLSQFAVEGSLSGAYSHADLPIERPARFESVVNLKIAKALGMTIPEAILPRADEVID